MRKDIDTQNREDLGASLVMDGGGPLLSACVAEERNRVSGQELTEEEGRSHGDLARNANERELGAWRQFKVSLPVGMGAQSEGMVDTRWVLTRKEVGAEKTV